MGHAKRKTDMKELWGKVWKSEPDAPVHWIIDQAQFRFENQHGEVLYAFLQKEGNGLKDLAPWQLYLTHSDVDWSVIRTKSLETLDFKGDLICPWVLDDAEGFWLRGVIGATHSLAEWNLRERTSEVGDDKVSNVPRL